MHMISRKINYEVMSTIANYGIIHKQVHYKLRVMIRYKNRKKVRY